MRPVATIVTNSWDVAMRRLKAGQAMASVTFF
jgi:hypothetical protein